MNYLVYFLLDKQIVLLDEDDVLLTGPYEGFSMEDWKKHDIGEMVRLKATYDEEVFNAVLLQVCPNATDCCSELIKKLRTLVEKKHYSVKKLLSLFPNMVRSGGRQKMKPVSVSSQTFITILKAFFTVLY